MPISAFRDYDTNHWAAVRDVIERSITEAGFNPVPVWEHSSTDIIQGRIIRNLYELPLVVCDISGLNPNVMFELGLRLAFKLPVVLLADDKTKPPFDTNGIEHLFYDPSLHFQRTEKFIENLASKLKNLHEAHQGGQYRAFIDVFGAFAAFEPNGQKIEINEYLAQRLDEISSAVARLRHENIAIRNSFIPQYASGVLGAVQPNALATLLPSQEMQAGTTNWTPENQAILEKMWSDGRTASEIANVIGGVSRNAVIGKAHRLGLKSQPIPEDKDQSKL